MMRHAMQAAIALALASIVAQAFAAGPSAARIETLTGRVSLDDVVAACARTAGPDQAGAVVIQGDLRDANCAATLEVPCAVQLDGTAGVHLTNCRLDSETLNLDDSASASGRNVVQLTNVRFVGRADAGLLIQLTDPDDEIRIESSALDYPLGIALHAPGSRTLPDHGGTVRANATAFTASGPTSAGLVVTASTSGGKVSVANPTITAPSIVMVADDCRAVIGGKPIDCDVSTLAADLRRQAHVVDGD
jgi:hypothetical protein